MELVHSLNPEQIQRLNQLYQNEWWCKGRSLEDTHKIVSQSSIVFGVVDNGALIGFARVLTDYVFKALIFDVIVDPDYRGGRIGAMIIGAIKTHNKLRAVKHIELYCRPDMIPYYKEHGFTDPRDDIQLMRYEP